MKWTSKAIPIPKTLRKRGSPRRKDTEDAEDFSRNSGELVKIFIDGDDDSSDDDSMRSRARAEWILSAF